MSPQNERKNRRGSAAPRGETVFREPEVTRHSLPIRTAAPHRENRCRLQETLADHTRMLTEILERLERLERAGR